MDKRLFGKFLLIAFFGAGLALGLFFPGRAAAMVAPINVDFEKPFQPIAPEIRTDRADISGELPAGWKDNSAWAGVTAHYRRAPHGGVGGSAALEVEIGRIASGAAQLIAGTVNRRLGVATRVTFSLRSPHGQSVRCRFRQASAPYRTYWERVVEAGPQWRSWTFETPVRSPDRNCLFMFAFDQPGTVFIDNVQVAFLDLGAWAQARMSPRANLLLNARFPLGLVNGWSMSPDAEAPGTAAPDPYRHGIDGVAALRIRPPTPASRLLSPPIRVVPGKPHVLAFYACAETPKTPLTVRIAGTGVYKKFVLECRWQRFPVRFRPGPASGATVLLAFSAPSTYWLDAVQVEARRVPSPFFRRDLPEPDPGAPGGTEPGANSATFLLKDLPELHLRSTTFMGLQRVEYPGPCAAPKARPFRLLATLLGKVLAGSTVRLTETDVFGRVRTFRAIPAARFAGKVMALPVPPRPGEPMGSFRITVDLVGPDGAPLHAVSETVVHRIFTPVRFGKRTPESPFGIHVSPTETQCRMAQWLGFKWVRLHDAASDLTKWNFIEPRKGQWVWGDRKLAVYAKYGLEILGMLGTAPPWASTRPAHGPTGYWQGYYCPRNYNEWRRYVRTTVRHYRHRIRTWEVWNEPYTGFFRSGERNGKPVHGSARQYVRLLESAFLTAHEAAYGETILGPCTSPPSWSRECLELGMLRYIDGFSYHQYTESLLGFPGDAKEVEYRNAVAIQDRFGDPKPVWCTETGLGRNLLDFYDARVMCVPATLSAAEAAQRIVRLGVAELAAGTRHFFLYTLHGYFPYYRPSASLRGMDGSIQPLAAAFSNLARRLEGTRFWKRAQVQPGLFAYVFRRSRRRGVIVLLPHAAPARRLRIWPGNDVRDMMGNLIPLPARIGRFPVFLGYHDAPDGALALLASPASWAPVVPAAAGVH